MPSQEHITVASPPAFRAMHSGRPTIYTVIEGEDAAIELQTSAVLAMSGTRLKQAELASSQTDVVVAAARRLYLAGFYDRTAGGIQIVVTALDL